MLDDPGLLNSKLLPSQQTTANPSPCRRHSNTQKQVWLSLCGFSGYWCHKVLFEPSKHLWKVWGLILNTISHLLLSYWVVSFALGCGGSFLVGSNILLSVVQQRVSILEFSQETMSACTFTPPSWVALPIRTRPSFTQSQSVPSGSFHKPRILIHQRTERMKTTITEN